MPPSHVHESGGNIPDVAYIICDRLEHSVEFTLLERGSELVCPSLIGA
jgi:hypothetical protein